MTILLATTPMTALLSNLGTTLRFHGYTVTGSLQGHVEAPTLDDINGSFHKSRAPI